MHLEPPDVVVQGLPLLVVACSDRPLRGTAIMKARHRRPPAARLVRRRLHRRLEPLLGMALGFVFFLSVIWIFRKARRAARPGFPEGPRLGRLFLVRPRPERRAEAMGSSPSCSLLRGLSAARRDPLLDHPSLPRRDRARDARGRVADRPDDGDAVAALKPIGGSCAEFAGAVTLFGASWAGIQFSTTHNGRRRRGRRLVRRFSAVRWGVARKSYLAWVSTIQQGAIVAAISWKLLAA